MVAQIDAEPRTIAAEQEVAILWAVESGSRAWGFRRWVAAPRGSSEQ